MRGETCVMGDAAGIEFACSFGGVFAGTELGMTICARPAGAGLLEVVMRKVLSIVVALGTFALACSSAPAGGGDGGGGGSDGSSAADSSKPAGGEGPITFAASCPTLSACGGAVEGAWDYAGGCVENAFDDLKQACPSLQVQSAAGTVKGSVTFASGTVTRKASSHVSGTLVLPAACTLGASCSVVEKQLQKTVATAACAPAGNGCSCAVTADSAIDDADSYTVQGTKVVTGGGQQYDYCVQGSGLKYKELGNSPKMGGVFDLKKR